MGAIAEWLGGGALGMILLAVVGWVLGRGKAKAEVRSLEASTAASLVETSTKLREDMAAALAAERAAREKVAGELSSHIEGDLEGKRRRAKAYLEHQEWDEGLAKQLRDFGVDVSDPPPLHEEE